MTTTAAGFSDVEMVTMILTLVLAGHETTAHLISNGTAALLTHPDQLRLLKDDPALLPRAVHELMRWCGPVQMTQLRYAAADVDLAGTRIHKGDAVQLLLVSANFDPRHYTDPDRLDLTRHPASTTPRTMWVSATVRITAWAPPSPSRRAKSRSANCSRTTRRCPWASNRNAWSGCRCLATGG